MSALAVGGGHRVPSSALCVDVLESCHEINFKVVTHWIFLSFWTSWRRAGSISWTRRAATSR